MAKTDEYVGSTIGDWNIIEAVDSKYVLCECSICGYRKKIAVYFLERGQCTKCSEHTRKYVKIGDKFGEWEAIGYCEKSWLIKCRCSCGEERELYKARLLEGKTRSCGHGNSARLIDLSGRIINDIEVLKYANDKKWLCRCTKCGNIKEYEGNKLRMGAVGCTICSGMELIDLTNKDFGEWHVIKYEGHGKWICKCSCDVMKSVHSIQLRNGNSKSCGHNTTALKDMTNIKIGMLTALYRTHGRFWMCRCDCGVEKEVSGYELRKAQEDSINISCGCNLKQRILQTRIERYGEICVTKTDNPRTQEQIESVLSKDNMKKYLEKFGYKPSISILETTLGITRSNILKKIHEYKLENYVDIEEGRSKEEKEIEQFVGSIVNNVVHSDRTIIKPYELDIYIPDSKFAIEFNGNFWHSEQQKGKYYHRDKSEKAIMKGVHMLHIFEYEWADEMKREQLKSLMTRNILNEANIIYAKDTEVEEIEFKEADKFIKQYHLHGNVQASIYIGIKYNNELIGIMSFGTPRLATEYEYELIRLCYKDSMNVSGGTEKLFKYFIDKYNPKSIIAYSDFSKFDGRIYSRIGMKYIGVTEPNYKWVHLRTNEVLSIYKTTKKYLVENNYGTKEQTEDEIMNNLGYIKIYDCGNLKFEYKNVE